MCTQTAPAGQNLAAGAVTSYGYDANGNPLTTTPQGSANTGTAATAGSTLKSSSQTVDGLSRVATTTDANGDVTAYWYDGNDRLIQVVYGFTGTYSATAPQVCPNYQTCSVYTYDPDGNVLDRANSAGNTAYTYDHFDRLGTETLPSTSQPGCASTTNDSLEYTYDNVGNIATSCANARTTTFGYDADNEVLSAADTTSGVTSSCPMYGTAAPVNCVTYGYDADRRRTGTEVPGGVTQTYTFHSNGEIHTDIVGNVASEAAGVTPLNPQNYGYDYVDSHGRNTDLIQNFDGGSYTYDTLDRIKTAAVGGHTWNYTYDAFGNRLTSQEDTGPTTWYSYNEGNQLAWTYTATTAPTSFAYNSPPAGANTYTYDAAGNQLTGVAAGAPLTVTYSQRNFTSKTVGAQTYDYAYIDLDQTQRYSAIGTTFTNGPQGITRAAMNDYIHTPDGTLAWTYRPSTGTSYYYLYDGQGNVVGLVNSTQQLVDSYTYDPYGATTPTETVSQPFRYAAGFQDPTGLYHYGARYYDPTTGRFTQLDPSGKNPGYVYAGNDPINNSDPSGACFAGVFGSNCDGNFNLEGQVCLIVCVEGSISNNGDVSVGGGAGPELFVGGDLTAQSAPASSGLSGTLSCYAGPVTGNFSVSQGGGVSTGAGADGGIGYPYGCEAGFDYTF